MHARAVVPLQDAANDERELDEWSDPDDQVQMVDDCLRDVLHDATAVAALCLLRLLLRNVPPWRLGSHGLRRSSLLFVRVDSLVAPAVAARQPRWAGKLSPRLEAQPKPNGCIYMYYRVGRGTGYGCKGGAMHSLLVELPEGNPTIGEYITALLIPFPSPSTYPKASRRIEKGDPTVYGTHTHAPTHAHTRAPGQAAQMR